MTTRLHGRITEGTREVLLDAIYAAWKNDVDAGKSSLMIAGDSTTVTELNARARADRVREGTVSDEGLLIADGQTAGVGDEVVTRQNNRLVTTGKTWVKNGDRWIVTATNADGSMALRRGNGGGEVLLPADYVAHHVELAYATTAYRSQGRTTDTAHAVVSPGNDAGSALRLRDKWSRVQQPLHRHLVRPRPCDRPRTCDLTTNRSRRARLSVGEPRSGPLRPREPREGTTPGGGLQGPGRRVRDFGPSGSTASPRRVAGSLRTSDQNASRRSAKAPLTARSSSLSETPRRTAST